MLRPSKMEEIWSPSALERLRSDLREAGTAAGITPDVSSPTFRHRRRQSTAQLRARLQSRADAGESIMTLVVDSHGVLRWQEGSVASTMRRERRRGGRRRGTVDSQFVVEQFTFDTVGLSEIYRYLQFVDDRLTPQQGLWKWEEGRLVPLAKNRPIRGRVLLLIHGTFSNCQNLTHSLASIAPRASISFLEWAKSHYAAILCFNHPTLSRSPLLNALQLESLLPKASAIDIVSHSRGGMVARWWYEVICREANRRGKVLFVGAPLAGTSLAAPDRVRETADFLTNVGHALGQGMDWGTALFPFLSISQFLMSLVCSLTSLTMATPAVDALFAMIPGLDAQSRVQNNFELIEQRNRATSIDDYYAIASSFAPKNPGWAFWKYFTEAKKRGSALAAGKVFPGPNDLVVDRASMNDLGGNSQRPLAISRERLLDYGTNDRVHHLNYFDFRETIDFMTKVLKP